MSKLRMVGTAGLLGLVLLVMLVFVGCENKIKGKERGNKPPVLRFSNVPPDSSAFSLNPEVSWYAIDMDGYVTKYQYAVIIADSLHVIGKLWRGDGTQLTAVDSACSVLVRIPPETWVDSLQHIDSTKTPDNILKFLSPVDTTTSIVKIQLFARDNPNDTISQHIFVRAIDNDTAISNIIHRMFNRNNHLPKAYINYTPFRSSLKEAIPIYSLPETTETWKGIRITWEGADSDDYRGTQPNFFYKWELWGPFEDSFAVINNKTRYDQLRNSSDSVRLVASSYNEDDSTHLVEDKSLLIPFLDKRTDENKFLVNYPDTVPKYKYPDAGYGWYLFIVWTQDDAFVFSDPFASNDSTAHLWFRIVHPQCTYQSDPNHVKLGSNPVKKVLILDFAGYPSNNSEKDSDSTKRFYVDAFTSLVNADSCNSFTFRQYSASRFDCTNANDTLSRYNLVVYLNEGDPQQSVIGDIRTSVPYFREYLGVGGRVWAIGGSGSNSFGFGPSSSVNRFVSFDRWLQDNSPDAVLVDFARTYFGVLGTYNVILSCASLDTNSKPIEFIGARAYSNDSIPNLPNLETDYLKMSQDINWSCESSYSPRLPFASSSYLGLSLGRPAIRIYTFVSHPESAPSSQLNNKPCGSVYAGPLGPDGPPFYGGPIYKTAYLSFGLHFIQEVNTTTGAVVRDSVVQKIAGWLLRD